jgi:CrcB protein
MNDWRALLAVALGAAAGGVLRFVVSELFVQRFGAGFPYGTLFINVSGSFLIGVVAGLVETRALGFGPQVRLFAATGVLGGYTTFSTFSLEAIALLGESVVPAFFYIVGSVLLGCAGAFAGLVLTRLALR